MDATFYKNRMYGGGGAVRGNFYYPIIYSTEEREVGVWIDNKPLYQKSVTCGSITNRSSISLGIENVEHISFVPEGSWINDGDRPLPYVIGSDASNNIGGFFTIGTSDTSFEVRMGNGSASDSRNGVITVQYTKTTDAPGSGYYTTLGVPAVHYTTDEQVIGTYLGETLYRKVFDFSNNPIIVPTDTWLKVVDTWQIQPIRGTVIIPSSRASFDVAVNCDENDGLYIRGWLGYTNVTRLIVEYTKTS